MKMKNEGEQGSSSSVLKNKEWSGRDMNFGFDRIWIGSYKNNEEEEN